jgi:hypothetical protein
MTVIGSLPFNFILAWILINQQMYGIKTCPDYWFQVWKNKNLTLVFTLEYVIHTLFKCRLDCHLTRFSSMETSSEASFRNPGKKKWWKTMWVIMIIYEQIHLPRIHSTGWRVPPKGYDRREASHSTSPYSGDSEKIQNWKFLKAGT